MEENTFDDASYYVNIWKGMLGAFLGWSDERVIAWATETGKLTYLEDRDDIFYHETPQYWAASTLIPDALRDRLDGPSLADLQNRILSAFDDHYHYRFPENVDWDPYKRKVQAILKEYNEKLESKS